MYPFFLLYCHSLLASLSGCGLFCCLTSFGSIRFLLNQGFLGAHRNLHIELALRICPGINLLAGDTRNAGIRREARAASDTDGSAVVAEHTEGVGDKGIGRNISTPCI